MVGDRLTQLIRAVLLLLPVGIAWWSIGVFGALLLTLAVLLASWMARASVFWRKPSSPPLVLESILISHFVEKVRWSLDRLGLPYEERPSVGVVGAFLRVRSVPVLHVRTGFTWSRIANSSDILRFLWGRYRAEVGEKAAFLEPTERALTWEKTLDRYGADLQRWIYFHVLPHRDVTLSLWGARNPQLPLWQRSFARIAYPLLRRFIESTFRISRASVEKSVAKIEAVLEQVEHELTDGGPFLLGHSLSYADISLAALSSLWILPSHFAAGRAGYEYELIDNLPRAFKADVERWRSAYPQAVALIERLYAEERLA